MFDRPKQETLSHLPASLATDQVIERLGALAKELSDITDLESLQRSLGNKLSQVIDFDRCTLAVRVEPDDREYLLFEISPQDWNNRPTPQQVPLYQGWSGRVLTESKPYFLPSFDHAALSKEFRSDFSNGKLRECLEVAPQSQSLMLLPLCSGGMTVGSLNFSSIRSETYSPALSSLAHLLTALVGEQLGSILRDLRSNPPRRNLALSQGAKVTQLEPQQRLTSLIHSLPGIVFRADSDLSWSMSYLSNGCLNLTGYSSEELVGQSRVISYSDITHPEDLPTVIKALEEAIAQKQTYVVEYRIQTKAGEEKWLWEKGYGVFDQNGEVTGIEGFITDITERKQTELSLRQAEQKYCALVEQIPAIVYIAEFGSKGVWHYVSSQLQSRLGFSPEEWMANSELWYQQIHPEDQERVLQEEARSSSSGEPFRAEYRLLRRTGEVLWFRDEGVILPCEAGQPLLLQGVMFDITDRKLAEEATQSSEFRFRSMVSNVPGAIYRCNTNEDYTLEFISNEIEAISGHPASDFIDGTRNFAILPHPDDRAMVDRAVRQALAERQQFIIEYRIVRADGSIGWIYERGQGIYSESGDALWSDGVIFDITERKQAANLLASQKRVLEMIATDLPLLDILNVLIQVLEEQDRVLGSILLLDPDGIHLRYGAAPSLPADYVQATDGLAIGACAGSCGTAAYRREAVIVEDITRDPLWVNYWEVALSHGLRACWSVPILSSQGVVLGTFAIYYGESRSPGSQDWQFVETLTQLAGIAIERKRAEEALQQAEAKYRSIFENAVEGIFQTTPQGCYLTVNPMLARMYGYSSPDELIEALTDIEHQLYVEPSRRAEFIQLMQEHEVVWGFESQIYRRDGKIIWISECARALYDQDGQLLGYEGTVEDITQRKQVEEELHRRDNLLQGVAEATNCLLTNTNFDAAISEAIAIVGKTARTDRVYIYENHPHPQTGEVAMSLRFEWVQASVQSGLNQPYWQNQPYSAFGMSRWYDAFCAGRSIGGIVREFPQAEQELLKRDNILAILMVPIFVDQQLWGYVGFDDCHLEQRWSSSEESILMAIAASVGGAIKRQRTEEQMRHQAFHDALTGLPNRMLFNQRLSLALAHARRADETLAVMFLDLDRFKTINDTLGHAIGDRLLKKVTRRLTSCLREEDTIARWGGDEFTLLLPNLKSAEDAARIGQRIFAALKPAFLLDGHELHVTSSIGIALYPYNGGDAQTLLKNADVALYRAKEQGRNDYQFYTSALNFRASQLLTLDNSLHHALERNEFLVYYQPQINVLTGEVTQMEALLRWQHPELGVISPQTFIALAEENGLIVPIGAWVLQVACAQNKAWQMAGLPPLRVAVNLSARQFQQPGLAKQVMQILQETELEAQFLELEITETAAMRDVNFTTAILRDLKAMGVRIAIDDFGTGYSSLNYLRNFPLHALKIDRSFIQDLTDNPDDMAIISAIITLGRGLNLSVVAEGVETQTQIERLRSLQCEEMQGYWFSKPIEAELATQFLQEHRKF